MPSLAVEACFPPADLAHRAGEEIPRPGATGANVGPPATAPETFAPVTGALAGSIRRVDLPEGEKLVALTFDLCEAPGEIAGYDGRIVDFLRAEGIAATFFSGGKWLMTHSARAAQLAGDPLFEIGTHTWSHANLEVVSGARMQAQVTDAERALAHVRIEATRRACPVPARGAAGLFRFPYGACSAESLRHANAQGLLAVQWDVDSGDPAFGWGARPMAALVLSEVRPGSIVLMHANGRGWHTAEALKILVPALRARGYRFVTVSTLLAAGRPVVSPTCFNRRPGDTARWRLPTTGRVDTPPATPAAAARGPQRYPDEYR